MFEYAISVSMADKRLTITDDRIIKILNKAIEVTNSSDNAKVKGRYFELDNNFIDKEHVKILLKSNTEVIPSRAMSGLSRAMISEDSENIITTFRGCVFNSIAIPIVQSTNLSDVELLQEITAMLFNQHNLRNNKDKMLAREYTNQIRNLVIEYIQNKSIEN